MRGRPRPPLPALPRRTNSPSLHFGHLMPMVIGRVFFHQPVTAERAFFIERLIWLMRDARALDETARSLAVWVTSASEESAKPAALDGHLLAAIVAILGLGRSE